MDDDEIKTTKLWNFVWFSLIKKKHQIRFSKKKTKRLFERLFLFSHFFFLKKNQINNASKKIKCCACNSFFLNNLICVRRLLPCFNLAIYRKVWSNKPFKLFLVLVFFLYGLKKIEFFLFITIAWIFNWLEDTLEIFQAENSKSQKTLNSN